MRPRKTLLYIGNKLSKKGSTITSIETLGNFLKHEGFVIKTYSSQKNKVLRLLDMLWATLKYRDKVSFVLIDTYSTQNFYYAVAVATLCRAFKLSYIPILRGGNLSKRLKHNKGFSQKLFGKAFTNVAPSKYMMQQFKEAGFHNITHIPNTIEISNYPFQLRKCVTPKLLWVRSFSEIYNPQLALKIVEMLKEKGLDASLCMVGPDNDGSLKHCKKIATELNLPVTFPGLLQKKEWIELSKDYNIFINTTNFDNMPVSVMEAMALGLPVISTNVGGMQFLIDNEVNGVLLPANNAEAFVGAIIELCNQPEKVQNLTLNARMKMEGFDWENIKHHWIKLLDN